jgi:hypothetical protein
MQFLRVLALTGVLAAALPAAARAEVSVTLANGRVTVVAKDATVRQILTEWSRVGQVKIVNVERVPGAPISLELKDVPEDQALDLLLRSVAGYLAAPRAAAVPNASRYDRVVIMASAAVPRSPSLSPAPMAAAPPIFNAAPQPIADDSNDPDQEPPQNAVPTPNPRGPIFNTFPQPQNANPPQAVPAPLPAVPGVGFEPQDPQQDQTTPQPQSFPGTVAAPGMIAAPPAQPGQQPTRR